jgi:phosphohistidine phosphatase
MKRLYILRHAKAGQTNKNILSDHDRPLTEKGIKQCLYIGEYLKNSQAEIDVILSSTSKRTEETVENTLNTLGKNISVQYIRKLYLGEERDILNEINLISDNYKTTMIVGHNPGLHQVAFLLSGGGDTTTLHNLSSNYPPGSLAIIDFPVDSWSDISIKSGTLVDFMVSKKF